MRHEGARKVTTTRDREHFENRDIGAMGLDVGDVCVGGFGLDDDGLELGEVFGGGQLLAKIFDRNIQAVGNGGQVFLDEGRVVAEQKDAERGAIVDEDAAIAIEHAAARSNDKNGAN